MAGFSKPSGTTANLELSSTIASDEVACSPPSWPIAAKAWRERDDLSLVNWGEPAKVRSEFTVEQCDGNCDATFELHRTRLCVPVDCAVTLYNSGSTVTEVETQAAW